MNMNMDMDKNIDMDTDAGVGIDTVKKCITKKQIILLRSPPFIT
jgi:hypothetical protein